MISSKPTQLFNNVSTIVFFVECFYTHFAFARGLKPHWNFILYQPNQVLKYVYEIDWLIKHTLYTIRPHIVAPFILQFFFICIVWHGIFPFLICFGNDANNATNLSQSQKCPEPTQTSAHSDRRQHKHTFRMGYL